jgi:hypothetical protein
MGRVSGGIRLKGVIVGVHRGKNSSRSREGREPRALDAACRSAPSLGPSSPLERQ